MAQVTGDAAPSRMSRRGGGKQWVLCLLKMRQKETHGLNVRVKEGEESSMTPRLGRKARKDGANGEQEKEDEEELPSS